MQLLLPDQRTAGVHNCPMSWDLFSGEGTRKAPAASCTGSVSIVYGPEQDVLSSTRQDDTKMETDKVIHKTDRSSEKAKGIFAHEGERGKFRKKKGIDMQPWSSKINMTVLHFSRPAATAANPVQ